MVCGLAYRLRDKRLTEYFVVIYSRPDQLILQGKTEGPRVQPHRWPAAACEEPVAAHQAVPELVHTGHPWAGLGMLTNASENLCSPAVQAAHQTPQTISDHFLHEKVYMLHM